MGAVQNPGVVAEVLPAIEAIIIKRFPNALAECDVRSGALNPH
jgi:hypothetical protein